MRLDQAIAARFPQLSRRKARELIAAGRVLVNQRAVRVASREVADDDHVTVAGELPKIGVLASTDDWLAVDKPAGMPAQPTRDRAAMSLEEILRLEHRSIYLVHRLDTPTSGVMLFARNREAAARLSALFASGEIRKTYLARVDGVIESEVTIETPIDGKSALTIVRPRDGSVVEVEIKTGAYGAEYGKSTGGIFNVITKSGTNDIHGGVFGYFTGASMVREVKNFPFTGSAANGFSEQDIGGDHVLAPTRAEDRIVGRAISNAKTRRPVVKVLIANARCRMLRRAHQVKCARYANYRIDFRRIEGV